MRRNKESGGTYQLSTVLATSGVLGKCACIIADQAIFVKFLRRGNLQRGEGTRTSDELEGLGNALVVGRHVGQYQGRVNWGLAMVVEEEGRLTQGVVVGEGSRFEVDGRSFGERREWSGGTCCFQVVRSGSSQCPAAVCIGLGIFRHCE